MQPGGLVVVRVPVGSGHCLDIWNVRDRFYSVRGAHKLLRLQRLGSRGVFKFGRAEELRRTMSFWWSKKEEMFHRALGALTGRLAGWASQHSQWPKGAAPLAAGIVAEMRRQHMDSASWR